MTENQNPNKLDCEKVEDGQSCGPKLPNVETLNKSRFSPHNSNNLMLIEMIAQLTSRNSNVVENVEELKIWIDKTHHNQTEGGIYIWKELYTFFCDVSLLFERLERLENQKTQDQENTRKINSLKNKNKDLSDRIEQLENELRSQRSHREQIACQLSEAVRNLTSQTQKNHKLQSQVDRFQQLERQILPLESKIQRLQQDLEQMVKQRDSDSTERGILIAKLAEANRDRTKTASFSDQNLRNDILAQEFIQLKNQKFKQVAQSIFQLILEENPQLKAKAVRKQQMIAIRVAISHSIFVLGSALFTDSEAIYSTSRAINTPLFQFTQEIEKKLVDSFISILEISENEKISNSITQQISKMISQASQASHWSGGKFEARMFAEKDSEEYLQFATDLVCQSIYQELKFADPERLPHEILEGVKDLAKSGLDLVRKVIIADPPGLFRVYDHEKTFDANEHEVYPGWEDGGLVSQTVFPAYVVGDRIFEKAQVTTIWSSEKAMINSESNSKDEFNSPAVNQVDSLSGNASLLSSNDTSTSSSDAEVKTLHRAIVIALKTRIPNKELKYLEDKIKKIDDCGELEKLLSQASMVQANIMNNSLNSLEQYLDRLIKGNS